MGDFFTQSAGNFDTASISRHAGGFTDAMPIPDSLPSRGDGPSSGGFFGDITGALTKGSDFIGGLFGDFEMPDAETLRAITGLTSGISELANGFRAGSLREFDEETHRLEAQLAYDAALLEKMRDKKFFRIKEMRNEAASSENGLIGAEDIFADDRSTFALEQLTKQFNTKIFVFGKLREADKAALLADNEIYRGIQKGSARLLDTWSDLNPPKPKKKEKLGEA